MIKYVAPSPFLITNIPKKSIPDQWFKFENFHHSESKINEIQIPIDKICLLDSESSDLLCPDDYQCFSHFLIGGILGNTDEFDFDRTSVLRAKGFPTRNLGSVQMTSDTDMRVVKKIVVDKIPFEQISFVDRPEINGNDREKLILNFRFISDEHGKPVIADGIADLLINEGTDFDLNNLE
jgi:ribosome biogenesis SPOUT family RNA methylase Rps3